MRNSVSTEELPAKRPWPTKRDLLGVMVTPTTYDQAIEFILAAAKRREHRVVSCHAVHAIVTASGDPELRAMVNSFDMITPDGQPVRWGINLLYRAKLTERVYGPELTRRLCAAAARTGVSIYLYGGHPDVVRTLRSSLRDQFPGLQIAGCESPPFRALSSEEKKLVVRRINESGAGLVFIGLGCPKQDRFAFEHGSEIRAVQVCVGAAFDFLSGVKPMAPEWMQLQGLEWVYRLWTEPRRLWQRYLTTNVAYVQLLFRQWLRQTVRWPRNSSRARADESGIAPISTAPQQDQETVAL